MSPTLLESVSGQSDHVQIPVEEMGHWDVLVPGAGLAGVCAAVAASRSGARTLLVESQPYVGGNATIGLPLSSFRAASSPRLIVGGIPMEIVERLRKSGGCRLHPKDSDWLPIDCEQLQLELTSLLDEANVELLTYSPLLKVEREGRFLKSGVFYNKSRALRVSGDVVISMTQEYPAACCVG